MRLLVAVAPNEFLAGYQNVYAGEAAGEGPLRVTPVASLTDFGDLCLAGEADEVCVPSALDAVPPDRAVNHLAYWGSLTSAGGFLAVTGLDLLAVTHAFESGQVSGAEARSLLYGNGRRAAYTAEEARLLVEGVGLEVRHVHVGQLHYTIVASRPTGTK